MSVHFQLSSEVVQVERIVALIEREPLIARGNMISKSEFTGEETRSLPVLPTDMPSWLKKQGFLP